MEKPQMLNHTFDPIEQNQYTREPGLNSMRLGKRQVTGVGANVTQTFNNTQDIANLTTAVNGHTTQLGTHTTQISTLTSQVNTINTQLAIFGPQILSKAQVIMGYVTIEYDGVSVTVAGATITTPFVPSGAGMMGRVTFSSGFVGGKAMITMIHTGTDDMVAGYYDGTTLKGSSKDANYSQQGYLQVGSTPYVQLSNPGNVTGIEFDIFTSQNTGKTLLFLQIYK